MNPDPAALAKWPDVPACYGWLSLDRRGRWRLKGEVASHAGLIAFINRHYGPDDSGNWICQNGPQAVYVALDYTPLVLRLEVDGTLTAHTGNAAGRVTGAYLDDEGNVLLDSAIGIGLLDDRDLATFLDSCREADGGPASDEALQALVFGETDLYWHEMKLQRIRRQDVAQHFAFRPDPRP